MSDTSITFTLDGKEVTAEPGQTIMEAAEAANMPIPKLCYLKELTPHGSCRVCTVKIAGRLDTSCTCPVAAGMVVESDTDELNQYRKDLVDMLFVEGNHICPACEKSGNCELQGLAYELGIAAPKYPYQFPRRETDASHPDIFLDLNRCILCGRCVGTSRDVDGKSVFEFVGRGSHKKIAIRPEARLVDTELDITDQVVESCPVGSILKKRVGYAIPVGERQFDNPPHEDPAATT